LSTLAVPKPQTEPVTVDLIARSKTLTIRSNDQYRQACEEKLAIDAMIADRHALHDPVVAKAFETHRAATAARRTDIEPLENAKTIYERAINGWRKEQERIALEAARAEQAERERIALEEREREIEEAESAEAAPEEIVAIIERPIYVPPPVMPRAPIVPQVSGIRRKPANWKASLENTPGAKMRLIQFVAKNPAFEHLIEVNQASANALAKALKTTMSVPGLVAFDENA
jgi:hypothetical protein